jgi:hypothetical protein
MYNTVDMVILTSIKRYSLEKLFYLQLLGTSLHEVAQAA